MRVVLFLALVALLATFVSASFIARLKSIYLFAALDSGYSDKSEERINRVVRYRDDGGLAPGEGGEGRQNVMKGCDTRSLIAERCSGNRTLVCAVQLLLAAD